MATGSAISSGSGRADGEAWRFEALRFRPFEPFEVGCQLGDHVDVADHAEFPAELLAGVALPLGGVEYRDRDPLPPPVRESAV